MEEERIEELGTVSEEPIMPVELNNEISEPVAEEMTETEAYDRINRLNMALDELANDMTIDDSDVNTINNEIEMPSAEAEELVNDLNNKNNEEENELVDDKGSKGQFILIIILTVILIALLIAMLIFTNAL